MERSPESEILEDQIKSNIEKLREELNRIEQEDKIFSELINYMEDKGITNIPIESIYVINSAIREYVYDTMQRQQTPALETFKLWYRRPNNLKRFNVSIFNQYYQVDNPNATACVGKKEVKLSNAFIGGCKCNKNKKNKKKQ